MALESTIELMRGGAIIALIGIAIFFHRFARESGDRFFAFFAIAFFLLGISPIVTILLRQSGINSPAGYCLRLVAFALIIVAIVEKNLPKNRNDTAPGGNLPKDSQTESDQSS